MKPTDFGGGLPSRIRSGTPFNLAADQPSWMRSGAWYESERFRDAPSQAVMARAAFARDAFPSLAIEDANHLSAGLASLENEVSGAPQGSSVKIADIVDRIDIMDQSPGSRAWRFGCPKSHLRATLGTLKQG